MIYLDANATTPNSFAVQEAVHAASQRYWANPSSSHSSGRLARQEVENARLRVASLLTASPEEIIFTSGGTESNNLAIRSALASHPGRHIITSTIEHPSVMHPLADLESRGYTVTRVPVTPGGVIDLDRYHAALQPGQTALVSIMWANNETGVIQPVEDFVRAANEAGALVHVDAVQTVGKLSIRFRRSGIHFLSVSGHKMYGPKGIGVLALARHGLGRQVTIRPMILGGGQERSLRSGTENTSGIVGMGAAAVEAESIQPLAIASLRDRFEKGLREIADSVRFIGGSSPRVCNTSLFRIPGRSAEIITHKLDRQGIAVSSGSACHSGSAAPSKVLISMGLNAAEAGEAVRVSLSRFTTEEEIDIVLTRIGAILADGISRSRSSPSIGIEPQSGPDMSKRTEAGPEKEAA